MPAFQDWKQSNRLPKWHLSESGNGAGSTSGFYFHLNGELRKWRQQQDFDLPSLNFAWITEVVINVRRIQQQPGTEGFVLEILGPLLGFLAPKTW